MITRKDFFRKIPCDNYKYAKFTLIGVEADDVIEAINCTERFSPEDIAEGEERAEGGYIVTSFGAYKAASAFLFVLTSILGCKGYASAEDTDWGNCYVACADCGEPSDEYTAEWKELFECGDGLGTWDVRFVITDPSGIRFQAGAGAVSEETMFYYKDIVERHKAVPCGKLS